MGSAYNFSNIVILKLNDSGPQKHSVWNGGWNGEILSGPGDPTIPKLLLRATPPPPPFPQGCILHVVKYPNDYHCRFFWYSKSGSLYSKCNTL